MGLIDRWHNRGSFTCKTCGQPKTRHQHAADGVCDGCFQIDWERRYNAAKEELATKEKAEKDKEHRKLVSALKVALCELQRTPALSDEELRQLIGCAMTHGSLPQVGTDSFVQPVPDHCDRIVWRGHYLHLHSLVKST